MSFQPLQSGDTIGVFAPSSYVEKSDIDASVRLIEDAGYKTFIHPQTFSRHGQLAGTTAEKLNALHALYEDKSIKAIWAAGGGNRALDLLSHIDYDIIRDNPKPIIGFSDVTALLNSILSRTKQIGFHGAGFKEINQRDAQEINHLFSLLRGENAEMKMHDAQIMSEGNAQGILIGGCLSLFHYLCGSEDCPDLDGAILCLEDCGDHISRFDRMFLHMKRHGVFEKIGGLILGEFIDVQDGTRPFGFSIAEIVAEHCSGRDIPIVANAPFGHGKNNYAFPIGTQATLDARKGATSLSW